MECSVRKTASKNRIVVGDYVEIVDNEYSQGKYIINKCLSRRNYIPRPPLANIEKLLIVLACKPEPDLYLVDKLIIYCQKSNIEPVVIINKSDIASKEFIEDICDQYKFLKIITLSAKNSENINTLIDYISNSVCALCGQSAVGKSSLLNALIPNINLATQELSTKIDRGKHTTRVNEIYIYNNLMIADTPGFTSLNLDIEYNELPLYYEEFEPYQHECKYLDCAHIKEGKDCAVISALNENKINKDRYNRYTQLYQKLKTDWENKYD